MRKSSLLFILFLSFGASSQSWQRMSDLNIVERDDACSFVIDNKAYLGTGNPPWWTPLSDFSVYDPLTDDWTSVASLPSNENRSYATGFSISGFAYVFGGAESGNHFNDLWRYDPVDDDWTEMSPLPDSGRSGSVVLVNDTFAYIIGGRTTSSLALNEVWRYHGANDSWTIIQNAPVSCWRASANQNNDNGYLIFGEDSLGLYQKKLFRFNFQSELWSLLDSFPQQGRSYAKLYCNDSSLWVFGGKDSSSVMYNDFWKYDLNNQTWIQLNSLPDSSRRGGVGFLIDNAIYYSSGLKSDLLRTKETWKYDIVLNTTNFVNKAIHVFPNPTNEFIQFKGLENKLYQVRIFSISGQLLLNRSFLGLDQLNLRELSAGVYCVQLNDDELTFQTLIVKE